MHFEPPCKKAMRAWSSWCSRERQRVWMSKTSRTEWKEAQAPFYSVATIRIPRQVFDIPEQAEFCEHLSFTPWHASPEHRPLGVTNRLRKVIYDHISRVRHEMNETKRQEPQ